MIRFFRVTPPTVHQMVLSLEKAALISRKPGGAVRDLGNELVGGDQPSIQTSSRDARLPKPAASPIDVGSERVGRRAAVFVFRVLIARRA
jgi:hypothetical protein